MNAVPVVGTPLAYGLGFLMLVLIAFAWEWVQPLVMVAILGGQYAVFVLAARRPSGFKLDDDGKASTKVDSSWGAGIIIAAIVGALTPPLLGLGGAVLIARGNAFAVLWSAAFLLIASFLIAADGLANTITVLALAGVAWAIVSGSPTVQAGVAVALVWWMLLGGLWVNFLRRKDDALDALVRYTWIPAVLWRALWIFIAILCLLRGARLLLFR